MAGKSRLFDFRFSILVVIQLLTLAGLVYVAVGGGGEDPVAGNQAHWRNVAAKLHSAGVTEQAARFYEKYLSSSMINPVAKAKVAFSLGEMYEQSDQAEQALAWYYQVELYDPNSAQKAQAGKKIVALLEMLKKFSAASTALALQTELKKDTQRTPQGAVEVARVGDKKIFLHQVQEAMDRLPEAMRKALIDKAAKENFLRNYIADQLLYDKAQRLNYMDDPKLKKRFESIKKQLLVQKIITEEVQNKISVDPNDVKNYYQAHQDKYLQPARAKISLLKVKSDQDAQESIAALKKGQTFAAVVKEKSLHGASKDSGGVYAGEVIAGQGFSNFPVAITEQIFATAQGAYTAPILTKGAYYIFLVTHKTVQKRPAFDVIAEQVGKDYRMEKAQNLYQQLIEQTLAAQTVELYAERMQ